MPAFTSYLLSMAIVFVIWGAIWYNLDRAYGVRLRRWWHGLTHEKPLPADEARGFIYERDTQTKFTWALVLSTIQSVLVVIYSGTIDLLWEIPAWLMEVPLMLVGMYLGRPLGNLWAGKDKVFDKLDEWERDEDEADEASAATPGREVAPGPVDRKPQAPPAPPKKPEPEPELDPKELMERYTKRRGS